MDLNPGGIIAWLLVGLVAGWLAGQFMKGGGYGLVSSEPSSAASCSASCCQAAALA